MRKKRLGVIMTAKDGKAVKINYKLQVDGNDVDAGELEYLHGYNNIVAGLEEALEGKKTNEQISVAVAPEKGYGLVNEEGIQTVPRDSFPDDGPLNIGDQFMAENQNGQQMPFTITKITDEEVTVDFNHALAGKTLNFEVEILAIRDADETELEHGHIHSGHGHHH